MVCDTNYVIAHVRRQLMLPLRAVLPVVVVGELKSFALNNKWQTARNTLVQHIMESYPIADVGPHLTDQYMRLDAYSRGNLPGQPLPRGMSAHTMGKNDLWIAATALDLDMPLYTADNDFNHLAPLGLQLVKELPW